MKPIILTADEIFNAKVKGLKAKARHVCDRTHRELREKYPQLFEGNA